jgi:hypothetical protein
MAKRCHWQHAIEGNDIEKTCPVNIRAPKVRRIGDLKLDNDAEMRRTAFIYCLSQLWTRPQSVLVAQSFFMQKAEATDTDESPDFFKNSSTLAKIESPWLASWIGGFLGYQMEIMQRMVAYDADSLLQLVEFMAKVGRSFRLPKACIGKEVLRLFLEERIKEVGARPNVFKPGSTSIDDKGRVSWDKGCYKFVWEEGLATHVVHVPSNTKVPLEDHTRIKKAFVLLQNHSDCSVVVSKGV